MILVTLRKVCRQHCGFDKELNYTVGAEWQVRESLREAMRQFSKHEHQTHVTYKVLDNVPQIGDYK